MIGARIAVFLQYKKIFIIPVYFLSLGHYWATVWLCFFRKSHTVVLFLNNFG